MAKELPKQARAVIVGGGVIGTSIAYHLTKVGWQDVVLLERKQLTCGTTWHAAGLIGQLRDSHKMTQLAKYTAELYLGLEEETGQATGYKINGSLSTATHDGRFEDLKRRADMAKVFDLKVDVVGPETCKEYYPLLNIDDIVGGIFIPSDGQANPIDITQALAKGARMGGAQIFEDTLVTRILHDGDHVTGVETEKGSIAADTVILCCGMWTRDLAATVGVNVPLHACEHFYIVTEPFEGVTPDLPVYRDYDACVYYKEDAGKLLVGAFEPVAKPWGMDGIPDDFSFDELPDDFDHFEPILEGAIHRMPALETAGIQKFFCGPESFTPDDRYHLGEAPELPGLFVAAGLNSIGIQSAGGVGKVIAEWLEQGYPPGDLASVDIRRNLPFQSNRKYLHDRVTETLGLLYDVHWPFYQYRTSRNVRKSPFFEAMKAKGACFGEVAGWERPNWYAPAGVEPKYAYSFKRQNWFEHSAAEHRAVREGVGLFDQSSFAKFRLEGADAESVLNRVCANTVAVEPGRIVYTQWLNDRGGIEADLTVTRLTEDAFPFGTSREIEMGYAMVRASRITYMGELGWELYMPTEFAASVYETVAAAGETYGLVHAGMHAMNSLRIEKAYRHWGHDITDEDTPLEAGLGFAVAWDKNGGFTGKDALLRQKDNGLKRRLVQFKIEDPEPMLYHNEPVYRDGAICGYMTSGMYGHTLGGAIGLAYVENEAGVDADYVKAGSYEVEIAGERFPAAASLRPMYDPRSERVKV